MWIVKKCVCNKYALLLFCTSLSLVLRHFPLLIMPRSSVTHQGNITADYGAFTRGWRLVWVPDPPARQNHRWGWKQRELDSTLRYRWDSPYPMRRPELFIVRKDIQFYKQSQSEPSKHFSLCQTSDTMPLCSSHDFIQTCSEQWMNTQPSLFSCTCYRQCSVHLFQKQLVFCRHTLRPFSDTQTQCWPD